MGEPGIVTNLKIQGAVPNVPRWRARGLLMEIHGESVWAEQYRGDDAGLGVGGNCRELRGKRRRVMDCKRLFGDFYAKAPPSSH